MSKKKFLRMGCLLPLAGFILGILWPYRPRLWVEFDAPKNQKVVAIVDAEETAMKEDRVCLRTADGSLYLWRDNWLQRAPKNMMLAVSPPPAGLAFDSIRVNALEYDGQPMLYARTKTGKFFGWEAGKWSRIEFGEMDSMTRDDMIARLNGKDLRAEYKPFISVKQRGRSDFRPWFPIFDAPGKIVDELDIYREGALAEHVRCFAVNDEGKCFRLAAWNSLIDIVYPFVGIILGSLLTAIPAVLKKILG